MALNVGTLVVDVAANLASFSKGMGSVGKRLGAVTKSVQGLGLAATVTGGALTLIGRQAVQAFGAVEGAVNNALTLTTAQGEEFRKMQRDLTKTANRLSTKLGISASQIATGFYDVLSTGAKAMSPQFNQLADTALTMAKVVGLEPSQAIEGLSDTLKAFGLDLTAANRAAEIFFVTSRQAATTVPQLVDAMRDAAPAARAAGVSINDTAAILAAFAEKGVKGAVAGTSFRMILLRLAAAPADAKKALKDLNVEIFNADGSMRNILDIIENLQGAMGGMADEQRNVTLKALAGEEAFSKLAGLMDTNVDTLRDWSKETAKGGTLQGALATKLSGVTEQMNLFKIQIENAAASLGRDLLPFVKKLMSGLLGLIRWFQKLSPEIRQTAVEVGVWVAGIGAAVGVLSGMLFVLGPVIAAIGSLVALIATAVIPFAVVAGIIVGLVALFGALRMAWQENLGGIREIMASVGKFIVEAWGFVLDVADFVATTIRDSFIDSVATILLAYQKLSGGVAGIFKAIVGFAINGIAAMADTIFELISAKVKVIAEAMKAIGIVPDSLIEGMEAFGEKIDGARGDLEKLHEAATKANEETFGKPQKEAEAAIKRIQKIVKEMKKDTVGEELKQGIQEALSFLGSEGPGAVDAAFSGIKDALASAFDALPDEVKDFLRNALEKVKGFEFALPSAGVGGGGGAAGAAAAAVAETAGKGLGKSIRRSFGAAIGESLKGFGKGIASTAGQLIPGQLGSLIESGKTGAAVGGAPGAIAGVAVGLLSMSKQFEELVGVLNGILQAAADVVGSLLGPLKPVLGAVGILVTSVLKPLGPLLEALGNAIVPLTPVIVIAANLLSLLLAPLNVITMALKLLMPIIEAHFRILFAVYKMFAVGVLTVWIKVAKFFDGIISFFTGIVSSIFRTLANVVGKIGLKKLAAKLDSFADAVDSVGFSTAGAEAKLEEIKALTFETAMDAAAAAAEGFGDTVNDATTALLNVPEGFKLAAARFEALDPEGTAKGGAPPDEPRIVIEAMFVSAQMEPEDFEARLRKELGLKIGQQFPGAALFSAEGT